MRLLGPDPDGKNVTELLERQRRRLDRDQLCSHRGERGFCRQPGVTFDARAGWRCVAHDTSNPRQEN